MSLKSNDFKDLDDIPLKSKREGGAYLPHLKWDPIFEIDGYVLKLTNTANGDVHLLCYIPNNIVELDNSNYLQYARINTFRILHYVPPIKEDEIEVYEFELIGVKNLNLPTYDEIINRRNIVNFYTLRFLYNGF
jgi:hypothetical protein